MFRFFLGIALYLLSVYIMLHFVRDMASLKIINLLGIYVFFYYTVFSIIDGGIGRLASFHIKNNSINTNKQPIRWYLSNQLNGSISGYFLCHDTTINKEMICNLIIENLTNNKYSVTDEIRLNEERSVFNKNISELWSGTFSVSDEQNRNGELIVSAGRIENAWFYFIGTSADRTSNFMSWAVVKRAMDIIINSLNNYDLSYEDNFYEQK